MCVFFFLISFLAFTYQKAQTGIWKNNVFGKESTKAYLEGDTPEFAWCDREYPGENIYQDGSPLGWNTRPHQCYVSALPVSYGGSVGTSNANFDFVL